jgi:hypothetical protein
LISLGVPIALVLAAVSALDVPFGGGIGERTYRPIAAEQIRREYRLTMGEIVVDLTDLDLDAGETLHVDASVAVGSLQVRIPHDAAVDADARVRVGEIRFPTGTPIDGVTVHDTWQDRPASSRGSIELELRAGLGEVVVTRGQA